VLQGIASSTDADEKNAVRELLANMRGRTFLMYSAHINESVLFETRWVMSYLKGPISLAEVNRLPGFGIKGVVEIDVPHGEQLSQSSTVELQASLPLLPGTITQRFVQMPIPTEDLTYIPWLAGRAKVRFYSQARGIDQVNDISLRLALDDTFSGFDWSRSVDNPAQFEEITKTAPSAAQFRVLPASVSKLKDLREAEKKMSDHLYHSMELSLWRVTALKLESQLDETEGQFRQRVVDCLREKKEAGVAKLEEKYLSKQKVLEKRLEKAYDRIEKEKGDVQSRGIDTALSFGIAVFGALFGRKALSVSTASRSAQGMRNAGRMMKEKGDVKRVSEEAERVEGEIAVLAQEFQEKVAEVSDKYGQEKFPLKTFSITPRRSDIFDMKVFVQWEPELDLPPLR